jgi:hypothetical protein
LVLTFFNAAANLPLPPVTTIFFLPYILLFY